MTGMPDLALNFINHRILDDVSFHPCVRSVFMVWHCICEVDKPEINLLILSCQVPKVGDRQNTLFRTSGWAFQFDELSVSKDIIEWLWTKNQILTWKLQLQCKSPATANFTSSHQASILYYSKWRLVSRGIWCYRTGYVVTNIQIGKFDISINPRSTDGKPIEKVVVTIPMSKSTTTVNATCNVGQYMFDPVTKVWEANVYTPRLTWSVPNRSFVIVYQMGDRQNASSRSNTNAVGNLQQQVRYNILKRIDTSSHTWYPDSLFS